MATFSKQVKRELMNAMQDQSSAVFVVDGKLVSVEMEDVDSNDEGTSDLAKEIENDPELKASLQRYLDHPEMRRYSLSELKEIRNERRR